MSETKFYRCEHCGNIVAMVHEGGGTLVCCGDPMTELKANTTDAATEKHVPVITVDGNKVTVKVGSTLHPMTEEHYIMWIYLETEKGGEMKHLTPKDEPIATFALAEGDKPVAAFEYCNLHGLWKADC